MIKNQKKSGPNKKALFLFAAIGVAFSLPFLFNEAAQKSQQKASKSLPKKSLEKTQTKENSVQAALKKAAKTAQTAKATSQPPRRPLDNKEPSSSKDASSYGLSEKHQTLKKVILGKSSLLARRTILKKHDKEDVQRSLMTLFKNQFEKSPPQSRHHILWFADQFNGPLLLPMWESVATRKKTHDAVAFDKKRSKNIHLDVHEKAVGVEQTASIMAIFDVARKDKNAAARTLLFEIAAGQKDNISSLHKYRAKESIRSLSAFAWIDFRRMQVDSQNDPLTKESEASE